MRNAITAAMLLLFLSLAAMTTGCAGPAQVGRMVISPQEVAQYRGNTPLKDNVSINNVTGGQETNPLWTSEIGNNEFRQALEQSLRATQLLSRDGNSGRYILSARILSVDQPLFGFSITVTTTVQYTLVDKANKDEVFNETISAPYTATVSDSFYAVDRLMLANEGSARANIRKLIQMLFELKISTNELSGRQ